MDGFYTLITGGSAGIGKALAKECAERGMNLILVSRPGPRLENTVSELKASVKVDVKHFPADLRLHDSPRLIYEWCKSEGLKVDCLINNAGVVGTTPFYRGDPQYFNDIITVNIRALTLLTRYFVADMKDRGRGKIINIGSLSGYFPIPYKSVYSASKSYVLFFSRSLAEELRGTGVGVFHIAPNGVSSNPDVSKRIEDHKLWGKLVSTTTEKFARLTMDKVEKGKHFYIPLPANKILFAVSRFITDGRLARILKNEFRKEL